jgi:2-keto-4-pentenoate hydratase/2-oxohepta-3-ene-1,7-dioic acid hydratase in catechol pathway
MKLALYRKAGEECFGAIVGDGVVTLNGRLGPDIASLADLLAAGATARAGAYVAAATPDAALADITLLPLLPAGAKILCAGLNYQSHADEIGRDKPKPNVGFFVRVPSSLVAHGAALRLPKVSTHFDFEGEICAVIGTGGAHIPVAEAMGHVAGYTCLMDGSVRDYQKNSVTAGKNFDASGAVGPWMVTVDALDDAATLTVTTRVNGEELQHSSVDRLIHSIPRMIAYMSGIMRLSPGDLLATGSPHGSGQHRTPQRWLQDGDRVEVEVSGVGTLSNPVVAEL